MKQLIILLFVINSLLFSQWEKLDFLPLNGRIAQFHMIDSLNIVAVIEGDFCSVIKSSDGGRNWVKTSNIPVNYIDAIDILNERVLFINSFSPEVNLKTTDGGANWTEIVFPEVYSNIRKFQFIDTNTAYAMARVTTTKHILIKTTDGGITWSPSDSARNDVSGFRFKNENEGWLFGSNLYHTTNGGNTFIKVYLPSNFFNPSSIDIVNDSIIAVGGSNYVTYQHITYQVPIVAFSTNRGVSWRVKDFNPNDIDGEANNIRLLDENTAITTLKSSLNSEMGYGLLYTTDRGVTWNKGTGAVDTYIYSDMKTINKKVYVGGQGAAFLASSNHPADPWELRFKGEYEIPEAGAFLKSGYVAIGTYAGSTKPGNVYISNDRGNNWVKKTTPWSRIFDMEISRDSILFFIVSEGLYRSDLSLSNISLVSSTAISDDELEVTPNGDLWLIKTKNLLYSNDDGLTWQTKFTSTQNISSVKMLPDGYGFLNTGSLYKTTDNGNTWTKLGFSQFSIYKFDFYDRNNGFICYPYTHSLHRTTDGGVSFYPITLEGLSFPNNVFCFDSLNIFLCGNSILSTYDGGWIWKQNQFQIPLSSTLGILDMYMFDHFDGIMIMKDKGVWKTHNRGNTPVELSLFSALPFGNKVVLQWTTETETNNMGFEIERKYRNGEWKKIAFSKGSGTSTRKIFYGYDDYEPKAPAILYYRLKQIDYNGEFEYSNEVEVLLGEIPENYSIQQNYPNPFNPSTKVTFSLPEENKVVIRVFNAMGEQIKEIDRGVLSHGYFEQDFEMGNESSGMYFCQVLCTNTISGRTKSLTVKMVLMK